MFTLITPVPPNDEVECEGAEGGEEKHIEVRYEHPVKWPVLTVPEGSRTKCRIPSKYNFPPIVAVPLFLEHEVLGSFNKSVP